MVTAGKRETRARSHEFSKGQSSFFWPVPEQ